MIGQRNANFTKETWGHNDGLRVQLLFYGVSRRTTAVVIRAITGKCHEFAY